MNFYWYNSSFLQHRTSILGSCGLQHEGGQEKPHLRGNLGRAKMLQGPPTGQVIINSFSYRVASRANILKENLTLHSSYSCLHLERAPLGGKGYRIRVLPMHRASIFVDILHLHTLSMLDYSSDTFTFSNINVLIGNYIIQKRMVILVHHLSHHQRLRFGMDHSQILHHRHPSHYCIPCICTCLYTTICF
jgi:hypothetical protein